MVSSEAVTLSLTGDASHTIVREPGVGSLTIGPPTARGPRPDVIVGADDAIDWSAFDPLTVPAGYPWPRSLRYRGNDTGLPADFEKAIRAFVRAINALPAIETSEREDAAEAVRQLAAAAPTAIAPDLAQSWFDAERDF